VFGEFVDVGDEPAQIHNPPNAGVLGGVGDDGGGAVVGVAIIRLADAVHQVVDDVDRTGIGERLLGGGVVVRVQRDSGDFVTPAEVGQPVGVSAGGDDVVAYVEQGTDKPRADIAGGAGNQDSHGTHRTEVPDPIRSESCTSPPAAREYRRGDPATAASTARSASFAVRGLVPLGNW